MHRPLFVTSSLTHGGAERHAITLANRLAGRGHDCHVAFVKDRREQLSRLRLPATARVVSLAAGGYLDRDALERLHAVMIDVRPTAVIAANEYALLYATLARRGARLDVPLVVTYHSTRLRTAKERLQMFYYRPLFWQAHCAVFVCASQRRYWRRRAVFARRNAVIVNGVDTATYRPVDDVDACRRRREKLGIAASDFVVGVAAGLRPEKNHVQLVDAIAALRRQNVPARALLIGDGPLRREIVHHARRRGVEAQVLITGFQADVRPSISICDAVVLCSTTETLSLAAIEGMAMGKPCVHSDVGGASELISPGQDGFLFPVGDTEAFVGRLRLLADTDRARAMGRNARRTVEARFSEHAMLDAYERLLEQLAGARLRCPTFPHG